MEVHSHVVARARAGDTDAVAALYRACAADIHRFVHARIRDHHAAEDLTQQTFANALRALPHYEHREGAFHLGVHSVEPHRVGAGDEPHAQLFEAQPLLVPRAGRLFEHLGEHRLGVREPSQRRVGLGETPQHLVAVGVVGGQQRPGTRQQMLGGGHVEAAVGAEPAPCQPFPGASRECAGGFVGEAEPVAGPFTIAPTL